ncbi:MAG: hypothetical protein ABI867_26130 [Kofleriaceae bacterium]
MFARLLTMSITLCFLFACEKTDHDSIDKWPRTEKGPGKLVKAVSDEGIDADLSAHAAANLIKPPLSQENEVRDALERMTPGRRSMVLGKLAPRLWEIARVESEKKLPLAPQIAAKDALVMIRKFADDALKPQIDGYLTDWYAVTSYEKRAEVGHYTGALVVRTIGQPFSKKLVDVINGLIAAPGQDKEKFRIGDELMLAIAASGSPEGVKKLVEVARMDRGDPTLAKRAFDALYTAYVDPRALFDIQVPDAIVANLDAIVAVAKDDTQPGSVADAAMDLIRVTPGCFPPLLGMIASPHKKSRFKYATAGYALRCGGAKTIQQVVRALPESGAYVKDEMTGGLTGVIAKMTPRAQVQAALRELIGDKGTLSKWVAIESLAAMKSVEDKDRIAALAGVKDRLVGYWGDNAEDKKDPTLGERAKELADSLGAAPPK